MLLMSTVLHVDDNESFLSTSKMLLEATDQALTVETATSPDEGLALLRSNPQIECIISDYDMPEINGLEFLQRVRSEFGRFPFILFTGEGSEKIASEAISAGVTDYIQKSTGDDTFTVLANRVQEAIEKYAAEKRATRRSNAIDQASEGIAVIGANRELVEVNETYADIHEADTEDLLGVAWTETLVQEESDHMADVLSSLTPDDEWCGEIVGQRANGGQFKKHVSLHRTNGHTTVTVTQETSKDKETGSFVRGTNAPDPVELIHNVGDALYAFDEHGHFSFVNQTFCNALSVDTDDVLGEHFSAITAQSDMETARNAFQEVADPEVEKTTTTYEKQVRTGDGEWIPVETHIARLPGEEFRGVVGVVRNVADRRERVAKLKAQNERLDEVASFISHDLRTPLMTLDGCLSHIETDDTQFLKKANGAVQRMEEMIDGVSQLAREGWTVKETEEVRLADAVTAAWNRVEGQSATLVNSVPDDWTIEANEQKLKHLLENLLKNAVDHCDSPTVTVETQSRGFKIVDDGPGIPNDKAEDIFEPGYSTDAGSGLGLAHVAKIVDAHGWDITATSGHDSGAVFSVETTDSSPVTADQSVADAAE